ncbi:MAG: hypothetical protein K5851_05460 [Lachnospiraceae bacterium]|nr:hypothetical protein [Lachnospiraceae bacterium]
MIGYKGIELRKGILRAKNRFSDGTDIFEVGIEQPFYEINDGPGFTENGYSFCGTIEDVLYWENYLTQPSIRRYYPDIRLFEIETGDSKVIGVSSHYKAEKITVVREITQEEIIDYFEKHADRLKGEEKTAFDIYKNEHLKPYEQILDKCKINETIVNSCIRLRSGDFCLQSETHLSLENCSNCKFNDIKGDALYDMTDYFYLHARRQLYEGKSLDGIEEYHELDGHISERVSLELLYKFLVASA